MSREDAMDRVEELLERIADAADADVEIEVYDENGEIVGEYLGEDVARLIGHHGQTIDAIQHLAYRIASRGEEPRPSVVIDADGYRERRAETLRATADQAVATALRDNRPVPLEPMSALERKEIHEHLKDRDDVTTYSEGQEPRRHLVVAPADAD